MHKRHARLALLTFLVMTIAIISVLPVGAGPASQGDEEAIARGRYLANIAGCIGCHSGVTEDFQIDESNLFGGGEEFDLGPLGVVYSKNLTPDPDTGLGEWTDDEIKTAVRTGVSRDGLHLFPVMPYVYFTNMDEDDLNDIIAFLRSVEPINNSVPREQILPPEALPQLTMDNALEAPDPSDTAARAQYLFTAILACSDCHTPVDPETGAPQMDLFLSGGQPFEGPWGVVYGGNITPHPEAGIGSWSDEDIKRVMSTGVRPDGRRAVLMPWPEYSVMTDDDLNAVVYFLRNEVQPVDRSVPAAALNEEFISMVPVQEEGGGLPILGIVIGVVALLLGVAALLLFRANSNKSGT